MLKTNSKSVLFILKQTIWIKYHQWLQSFFKISPFAYCCPFKKHGHSSIEMHFKLCKTSPSGQVQPSSHISVLHSVSLCWQVLRHFTEVQLLHTIPCCKNNDNFNFFEFSNILHCRSFFHDTLESVFLSMILPHTCRTCKEKFLHDHFHTIFRCLQ